MRAKRLARVAVAACTLPCVELVQDCGVACCLHMCTLHINHHPLRCRTGSAPCRAALRGGAIRLISGYWRACKAGGPGLRALSRRRGLVRANSRPCTRARRRRLASCESCLGTGSRRRPGRRRCTLTLPRGRRRKSTWRGSQRACLARLQDEDELVVLVRLGSRMAHAARAYCAWRRAVESRGRRREVLSTSAAVCVLLSTGPRCNSFSRLNSL